MHPAAPTAALALLLAACTTGAPANAPPRPAAAAPAAPTAAAAPIRAAPEPEPSAEPAPQSSVAPPPTPEASASDAPESPDALDDGWPPALGARLARAANAMPKGKLVLHPPPDEERDRAIHELFGSMCHLERTCGPLWGIDCDAAVDGPYFYARPYADHIERITTCGGACMGGRCTNCPPRDHGWTCKTY